MNSHDCYDDLKFLTRYIYPSNFPIFESIEDSRESVLNYSQSILRSSIYCKHEFRINDGPVNFKVRLTKRSDFFFRDLEVLASYPP